jgi:hypothetical protein
MPCIQPSISHFYPPNQLLREAEPTPFWAQENRFFHGKRVSGQGQTGSGVQNQARTAQGTLPFSDIPFVHVRYEPGVLRGVTQSIRALRKLSWPFTACIATRLG